MRGTLNTVYNRGVYTDAKLVFTDYTRMRELRLSQMDETTRFPRLYAKELCAIRVGCKDCPRFAVVLMGWTGKLPASQWLTVFLKQLSRVAPDLGVQVTPTGWAIVCIDPKACALMCVR